MVTELVTVSRKERDTTMADIKSKEQKELEVAEELRNLLGNVTVNTSKLLLIYARQSTNAQFKGDVYSMALQTKGLIQKAIVLGWTEPYNEDDGIIAGRYILFVENEIAEEMGKKRMTSGRLPIDDRLGLKAVTDFIDKKQASAVIVVDVSRLFRDETGIQPATFVEKCKQAKVQVLTDDYTYDFTLSKRGDGKRFRDEADEAAAFIPKHILGKMLKARKVKAHEGKLGNGVAPVGLMRDETGDYLIPSPHAEKVNEVYQMFHDSEAKLNTLLRKFIDDAKRGIPLFPVHPSIRPETMYLTKVWKDGIENGVLLGWTITSRCGLQTILRNPVYLGHVVWNGEIVAYNKHKRIVDPGLWDYAFTHLARYDLDGNEIVREEPTVRYQQKKSHPHNALLAGTRHNGKPVIDGVDGAHVYVQLPGNSYVIKDRHGKSVNGFLTSIGTSELDSIIEQHLKTILIFSESPYLVVPCESPYSRPEELAKAVYDVESQAQGEKPVSEYDVVCSELERVQRILDNDEQERYLTENRRNKYLLKEKQLTDRKAEIEYQDANKERIAEEQRQAKEDIKTAQTMYAKWPMDRKRRLIHIVTDAITLEEIADGWLRLTIYWSELVGGMIEHCYIWRTNGSEWTQEELDILREHYPTASKDDVLRYLPKRSWNAIMRKAITSTPKLQRSPQYETRSRIPNDISLTDVEVMKRYALLPKSKVQWHTVTEDVSNVSNHKWYHH
jgi:Recombinase